MMNRRIFAGAAPGLAAALFLAGCQGAQTTASTSETAGAGTETVIDASGSQVNVTGNGAAANGMVITISQGGNYRLTGTIDDGQLLIQAGDQSEVRLILDGFSISSSDRAAIYADSCETLTIQLEESTENYVGDSRVYDEANPSDDPDAPIFCENSLILEGGGTLEVNGSYQEGIRAKGDLSILSGTYRVEAANDGIKGKDSVAIQGGDLSIQAGGDGIQADNDSDEGKGTVSVSGGSLQISAAEKGIKAVTSLLIEDGIFSIQSEDDAVHSNGDVTVTGGSFTLATGDDGIHGDGQVTITGGTIGITESYEGIEGLSVDISGDTDISIVSTDDGINAAGGDDTSGTGGRFGGDPFAAEEGAVIRISSGTVAIQAGGDGVDSNGDFYLEGGTLYVESNGRGDGILDYNGTGSITGGIFAGAGTAGMFQYPSGEGNQPALVQYFDSPQAAGSLITVAGADGETLFSWTPAGEYSVFLFSSPDLTNGDTYQLTAGETTADVQAQETIAQTGAGGRGGMGGGMGGGRRPGNGERPADGEWPENGDIPAGGERPENVEIPAGGEQPENGESPAGGERPERGQMPPDGEQPENGQTPPDGAGTPGAPGGRGGRGQGGGQPENGESPAETFAETSDAEPLSPS